jgi:hypothetical protein
MVVEVSLGRICVRGTAVGLTDTKDREIEGKVVLGVAALELDGPEEEPEVTWETEVEGEETCARIKVGKLAARTMRDKTMSSLQRRVVRTVTRRRAL